MTTKKGAPLYFLQPEYQAPIDRLWAYLHNPRTVLGGNMPPAILTTFNQGNIVVSKYAERILDDRMSPLRRDFARLVFTRGLYAAADDSANKAVLYTNEPLQVGVGATQMKQQLVFTVVDETTGTEERDKARHLTFACPVDDPSKLELTGYYGRYSELNTLVQKAATLFTDPAEGYRTMAKSKLVRDRHVPRPKAG